MFADDIMSAFTQAERTSSEVNYDMACLESQIAVVSCQDFWQMLQLTLKGFLNCICIYSHEMSKSALAPPLGYN